MLFICGMCRHIILFFFNDTATTEIYTLSLHDALPISGGVIGGVGGFGAGENDLQSRLQEAGRGTALGTIVGGVVAPVAQEIGRAHVSSHANISYAVFCLKKKKPILYILPSYVYSYTSC